MEDSSVPQRRPGILCSLPDVLPGTDTNRVGFCEFATLFCGELFGAFGTPRRSIAIGSGEPELLAIFALRDLLPLAGLLCGHYYKSVVKGKCLFPPFGLC